MPLSEQEQAVLDEMEQALAQDDPKFASHMSGDHRRPSVAQWVVMAVGAILATGCVLAAVSQGVWWLALIGLLALTIALWWGMRRPHASMHLVGRPESVRTVGSARRPRSAATPRPQGTFMQRMEERWEARRRDQWM